MFTKFAFVIFICLQLSSFPAFHCQNAIHGFVPDEQKGYCICMPYWQCHENYTGLSDVVTKVADVRSFKSEESLYEERGTFSCANQFDVCCKVECGRRRPSNYAADEYGFGGSLPFPLLRTRILGEGNEAEFGEFPWMLGILRNDVFECGGSLIHPKVALTAAHCVFRKTGSFKVRAGEWDWQSESENPVHQDRFVEMMVLHQQFNPVTVTNDIALLILNRPFILSYTVGVACIPPPNVRYSNVQCVASGWGKNSYYGGRFQTTLKKQDLPLVERDKCTRILQQSQLGSIFSLDRSFICAGGEENRDTCQGDGGSPLVCPLPDEDDRYEQIGIVSWGLKCGLRNTPGVYVNVILFSSWIDAHMKNLGLNTNIYKYQH